MKYDPEAEAIGSGSILAWADQEWKTCERSSARTRASLKEVDGPVGTWGDVVWVKAEVLSRAGKAEVDGRRRGVGPAGCDDLAPRVEAHALGAVHVGVAEQ